MKQDFEPSDEKLNGLLKSARQMGELPPGFENCVWQRIEKMEEPQSILDRLAKWLLVPRVAFGTLAAVVLIAGTLGAVHGASTGATDAKDRYVASVDPSYLPH